MKTHSVITLILSLLFILLEGCGKEGTISETSEAKPIQKIEKAKAKIVDESKEGDIRLIRYDLPKEELVYQREKYKQNDLLQIPSDPVHNTTLFQIKNVDEYDKTIFIGPKVYAISGQDGARLSVKRKQDSSILVSFPIVITTGVSKTISGNSKDTSLTLPDNLLIKEYASLVASHPGHKFSALPGCPKRIILKFLDMEYDATPTDMRFGDYCEQNSAFDVAARLHEDDARYMLETALYNNAVEVRVEFETKANITTSQFSLEFDKQKLFSELEAKLSVDTFYADVEVRTKITKVMEEQALKMRMVGEINDHLNLIVSEALAAFFEKFRPDPKEGSSPCGNSIVCFRLSYNSLKESKTFKVTWMQSETTQTGQHFLTWTKLKAMDDTISIGKKDVGLSNMEIGTGNSIESGLTIQDGQLLVIKPTFLDREIWEMTPSKVRHNNNVCVKTKEVCRIRGGRHGRWDLATISQPLFCEVWETVCTATENRWKDITSYSFSKIKRERVDNPVGKFPELYDGLYLKFTWNDLKKGPQERLCPLRLFHREGNGKELALRIENHPQCEIFTKDGNAPLVHLINKISFPVQYLKGQLVQHWNGSVSQKPVETIYQPEIKIGGEVFIKGSGLGNTFSKVSQTLD